MSPHTPPQAKASGKFSPQPPGLEPCPHTVQCDRSTPDTLQLLVGPQVGCGQRGDIHRVPQWLVAGGVDEIAQDLFVVLDASTLWVAVTQEDEFLLLPCPESSNTFLIHL